MADPKKGPPTPSELMLERNLFDVFMASQALPKRAGAQWARCLGVAAVGFYAAFTGVLGSPTTEEIAKSVRELAKDGLGFSSQVIGFVLAGFTIFATMGARSFTLRMAAVREPQSQHSFLKYVYLSFMRVFAIYLAFIAICLGVRLFGDTGNPADVGLSLIGEPSQTTLRSAIARAGFVLVAGAFWLIVVELFSFTFNVYHTVMSSVRWEFEQALKEDDAALKAFGTGPWQGEHAPAKGDKEPAERATSEATRTRVPST